MNVRSALTRLASMDPAERAFRLQCEAHKTRGRAAFAMRRPSWALRDAARLLDPASGPIVRDAIAAIRGGDFIGGHRALCRHFEQRGQHWPLHAGARTDLVTVMRRRFPAAAIEARDRANRILDGQQDLLGYRGVGVGSPPDWHADPVNRRQAPRGYWAAIPYLDPSIGDHKVIWEINRHQSFLQLGAAWWLTGEQRFREGFIAHLESWLAANPPLDGINWTSMLELAFRGLSWTWAVEFFCAGGAQDDRPWLLALLVALDRQLTHIEQNLSLYFSPNTHLSGEALALYAVSLAFPELRASAARLERGRSLLMREAGVQVRPDGGHAELSAHYHRYSTDFYLLALMAARARGDEEAAVTFERSARAQAQYLRTIADDKGRLPSIGDDDGGQLFRFSGEASANAAASLSVAADLFDDPGLAVSAPGDVAHWVLGREPRGAAWVPPANWPSRLLPDSGYFVSRSAGGRLIFDAGPHGFLNGGHAHADALSIVLSAGGEPLLVDPGTASYTMDPEARDRFRSARMHNTVTIDGASMAEPCGPFHWRTRANGRMLAARTDGGCDFAVATHDGYGGRHTRSVQTLPGTGWLILDSVQPDADGDAPTLVECWWHIHPAWTATQGAHGIVLTHTSGLRLGLVTTAAELTIVEDGKLREFSPEYGRIEHGTTLRAAAMARAPVSIATFIPSQPVRNGLSELVDVLRQARPDIEWPQPCIQERRAVCVE